jgi:hypothetical protein
MKNDITVFLLELGFWFDHPSPYAAACLVLVIISGAADLSTSTREGSKEVDG